MVVDHPFLGPQLLVAGLVVMVIPQLERLHHDRTLGGEVVCQLAELAPPLRQTMTAEESRFLSVVAA